MKSFTKSIVLFLLSFSWVTGFGQTSSNVIGIGTIDSVYSNLLKEKRRLFVYVPEREGSQAVKPKYPVVYLLDGGANFHAFVGMLIHLSEVNRLCPPMVVIGILNTDRMRDFTPTHIAAPGQDSVVLKTSGGGEAFTAFLEKELMPYIDAHYPTSPDRMLIGHSLGGLLAINTFIYYPDLFKHYVAIDPSLTWDGQTVLKNYLAALPKQKFLGKTFFLTAANLAGMDSTSIRGDTRGITLPARSIFGFADALTAKNDPGLDWACHFYPGESHHSVPLISEYDALKFIFRKKTVQLTATQLNALTGKYRFQFEKGKDEFLQVTTTKNYLTIKQLWDGLEFQLVPESEVSFYCQENPFTISFIKDDKGQIKQALVQNMDLWTKVEP